MDSLEVDLKSQAAQNTVSNTDSNRSDESQKGASVKLIVLNLLKTAVALPCRLSHTCLMQQQKKILHMLKFSIQAQV